MTAVVPGSYGVGISETGDQASDHRLVWVDLDPADSAQR